MRRAVLSMDVALISCFILSGCLPDLPAPAIDLPSPTLDVEQKASPAFTPDAVPASSTEFPTPFELFPTRLFTPIPSFTPVSSGTVTALPQSTATPASQNLTAVLVPDTGGSPDTVSIDKLPPNTVYKPARIQNISRTQVDISLHCITNQGLQTFLEYDNVRNVFTMLPEGNYSYVVYVGGRRLLGNFSLMTNPKLFIVIDKDRVVIH